VNTAPCSVQDEKPEMTTINRELRWAGGGRDGLLIVARAPLQA
jgi:hypothetical protein